MQELSEELGDISFKKFTDNPLNIYQNAINQALDKITEAQEILGEENVEQENKTILYLNRDIKTLENEIQQLLEEQGLSREDIQEAKTAHSKISELNSEISSLEEVIAKHKEDVAREETIDSTLEEYDCLVQETLSEINSLLGQEDAVSNSTELIKISSYFDTMSAIDRLSNKIYDDYKSLNPSSSSIKTHFCDVLRECNKNDLGETKRSIIQMLFDSSLEECSKQTTVKFIKAIREQKYAKEIISERIYQYLSDKNSYEKISIEYGNKPINDVSFGQILEKFDTYNGYIRTRTKSRHNLKAIIVDQELGRGRARKTYQAPSQGYEPGEKYCYPGSIRWISHISDYSVIKRRRFIKKTIDIFRGYEGIQKMLMKKDPTGTALENFFIDYWLTKEGARTTYIAKVHNDTTTRSIDTRRKPLSEPSRRKIFRSTYGY